MGSCALAAVAASAARAQRGLIRTVVLLLLFLGEEGLRIHVGVEGDVEETDHHLFPALIAPADFLGRIGVAGIVDRVIEVRGAFDSGALGSINWSWGIYQSCQEKS